MKLTSLITGLVGAWMAVAPLQQAWAIQFPIEYSGLRTIRYTTVNTGPFAVQYCEINAALSITLSGNGTLSFEYEEVSITVDQKTGACSIRSTGRRVSVAGTHDLLGTFTVKFGEPPDFTMKGSYDDASIRADWRPLPYPTWTFEIPAASHLIALEPDPTKGWDFHMGILDRKGFKIVLRDPHGRDHLDLNSLRIIVGGSDSVAGTDTTQHVLSRLLQGIVPYTEESPDSRTKVYRIKPDPKQLMQGHDIFAIPFNGDWRIELRICDKAQTCFNTVYRNVYFGPFLSVWKVGDNRCATPATPYLQLYNVTIGNIGIDSPNTALYVGLASPGLGGTWTYHADDFGDGLGGFAWWQGQVLPMFANVNLPSGKLETQELFAIPNWISIPSGIGPAFSRRVHFPAGTFRFIAAALDPATGAYRRDEQDVKMCD